MSHGHSNSADGKQSKTYRTWSCMKTRCLNPNDANFKKYGAKGVTVCDRWMTFENFLEDMGERPDGMTLDRIDGTKGYAPENCRWATQKEQHLNKKTTIIVEKDGLKMPLRDAAALAGVTYPNAVKRLARHGTTAVEEWLGVGFKVLGKGV